MNIKRPLLGSALILAVSLMAEDRTQAQSGGHSSHGQARPASGVAGRASPRLNGLSLPTVLVPREARTEAPPSLRHEGRPDTTRSIPPGSFDRLTTTREEVVSTSPRAGAHGARSSGTSTGSQATLPSQSLHPYTTGAMPGGNSLVPAGSSWQHTPPRAAVQVRSQAHNYYPTMRSPQHLNAQVRGQGRCTVGRAHVLTGGHRGG
jgi:hypothetical protein